MTLCIIYNLHYDVCASLILFQLINSRVRTHYYIYLGQLYMTYIYNRQLTWLIQGCVYSLDNLCMAEVYVYLFQSPTKSITVQVVIIFMHIHIHIQLQNAAGEIN